MAEESMPRAENESAETAAPSSSSPTKKMQVGTREVELPEDVAHAYASGMEEVNRLREALATMQEQHTASEARWEQLQRVLNPQSGGGTDPDIEILRNPAAALQGMEARIVDRVRKESIQTETRKEVWQQFYTANKDLVGAEWAVEAILAKNPMLYNEPTAVALEKLAKLTRTQLMGILKTARRTEESSGDEGWMIERGSGGRRFPTDEGDEAPAAKPMSLTERLRKARMERHKKRA